MDWLALVSSSVVVLVVGVVIGWWALRWNLGRQGYVLRWDRREVQVPPDGTLSPPITGDGT